MHITFNGRDIELSFGLRTLVEIDKELGFEIEGASLGEGVEMIIPKLQSGNPVGISQIIKAATLHDKNGPKSYEDLEQVLDNIAENDGFQDFGDKVIETLGERPMTAALVPEELKPQKPRAVKSKKA